MACFTNGWAAVATGSNVDLCWAFAVLTEALGVTGVFRHTDVEKDAARVVSIAPSIDHSVAVCRSPAVVINPAQFISTSGTQSDLIQSRILFFHGLVTCTLA